MTKKEILKQVFDELHLARESAIFLAQQNEQKALQDQKYCNLEASERTLNMQIGKLQFEKRDCKKMQETLAKTSQKKKERLAKIGLSEKDLIPQFQCAKCKDTGIFQNSICSCASQKFFDKLMQNSNVDFDKTPYLREYDCNFFETEKEQQFAKKCVQILLQFTQNFDENSKRNIIMCGASGTGKTFLAKSIAKELLAQKKSTYFVSSFELGDAFLADHLGSSNNWQMSDLIDLDVLLIDDLGTEPMRKNVTKEYLLVLLSERLAKNKSTIITTNLNADHILAKYGERIFSRMFDKRSTLTLYFDGKNNRLKN